MTNDPNDPAQRLKEAALKSLSTAGALDRELASARYTADDVARAYCLCLTESVAQAANLVLCARLQVVVMQEHVAAQERMGRTVTYLTWALAAMTVALVVFGAVDVWQRVADWQAGQDAAEAWAHWAQK